MVSLHMRNQNERANKQLNEKITVNKKDNTAVIDAKW